MAGHSRIRVIRTGSGRLVVGSGPDEYTVALGSESTVAELLSELSGGTATTGC